jgi:hypothetical protein
MDKHQGNKSISSTRNASSRASNPIQNWGTTRLSTGNSNAKIMISPIKGRSTSFILGIFLIYSAKSPMTHPFGSRLPTISIVGTKLINYESDKRQNKAKNLTCSIKDVFLYTIGGRAPSLSTVSYCKKETKWCKNVAHGTWQEKLGKQCPSQDPQA